MLKSYLRYEQRDCFGVIASPAGNAVFDATGNMAICPALQDVIVWQLRRGTTVRSDLRAFRPGRARMLTMWPYFGARRPSCTPSRAR